jgi:hypothetical protein
MAVVGMAANPSGAYQAGRHRAGQMLPGMPGGETEGVRGWVAHSLRVEAPSRHPLHQPNRQRGRGQIEGRRGDVPRHDAYHATPPKRGE